MPPTFWVRAMRESGILVYADSSTLPSLSPWRTRMMRLGLQKGAGRSSA